MRSESIDPRGRIGLIEAVAPSGASPSAHPVGVQTTTMHTVSPSTPLRLACWPRCSAWPGRLPCPPRRALAETGGASGRHATTAPRSSTTPRRAATSGGAAPTTRLRPGRADRGDLVRPGFYGHTTACGQKLTPKLVGVASRTLAVWDARADLLPRPPADGAGARSWALRPQRRRVGPDLGRRASAGDQGNRADRHAGRGQRAEHPHARPAALDHAFAERPQPPTSAPSESTGSSSATPAAATTGGGHRELAALRAAGAS